MLINIVQTKQALWNFQIPLSERTKMKKKALWKEVENMLGGFYKYKILHKIAKCKLQSILRIELILFTIIGLMTMDDAMKRWKYLRDCYVRYKRQVNAYVPSGSAAQPSKKQKIFRFYEAMQFIDDPLKSIRYIYKIS